MRIYYEHDVLSNSCKTDVRLPERSLRETRVLTVGLVVWIARVANSVTDHTETGLTTCFLAEGVTSSQCRM